MMSLLDALNDVKKSNFDPKSGKEYNAYENIPAGTYTVSFDGITHGSKGSRDFLMITFLVIEGEYEGRKETIFPTLAQTTAKGNPMPDAVIARAISEIMIIGELVGKPVPDSCFAHDNETDAYEDIYELLKDNTGVVLSLTIKETPNHKDPDHPYRNYEFAKTEQPKELPIDNKQDPFAETGDMVEISDDDLPF